MSVINDSLADVEYNRGRFIRLEPQPAPDTDVRGGGPLNPDRPHATWDLVADAFTEGLLVSRTPLNNA